MNFVGHAMAALWQRDDPAFVLGSMLPDFAQICGGRLLGSNDDAIAAGIRFHHRTDAVFHDTPTFLGLCVEARTQLRSAGVARFTAMAAAHVGIELLLDGLWLDDPRVSRAYLRAIERTEPAAAMGLRWKRAEHIPRFERLCGRLRSTGIPNAYRDAAEVGRRVHRILAARPRLAPSAGDAARLIAWTRRAQPRIRAAKTKLGAELRLGLSTVLPEPRSAP